MQNPSKWSSAINNDRFAKKKKKSAKMNDHFSGGILIKDDTNEDVEHINLSPRPGISTK